MSNHSHCVSIEQAAALIKQGRVIAYPTEAVYGLGCDPRNEHAVKEVRDLKSREHDHGLLLVIADWKQVSDWVISPPQSVWETINQTWPGPTTWVFQASDEAPSWLLGPNHTLAVRCSAHPVVRALCDASESALVSTSANPHGQMPAMHVSELELYFSDRISCVEGALGTALRPCRIIDAMTGNVLRD